MAGTQFQFDESGDAFFCFLVAFYTLILLPLSYFCWPSFESRDVFDQGKRKCICQPCQIKRHNLKSPNMEKRIKKAVIKGGFIIAWIVFFILIYKLTLFEPTETGFDPFETLDISRDASNSDIRKAYKRLSLKYHPDKGGDPIRFIQISKAYSALTDEQARKNWEEFGNPDGPGVTHFGIALPKWMIEKENFYVVIGAYVLLFMLILPIAVGSWWYNTMKFSNNRVLLDTVHYFYGTFMRCPSMALVQVIKVLSNALEFNPCFNKAVSSRPSDNVEVTMLTKKIPHFTVFNNAIVGSPYSVKARALIFAHFYRLDLPTNTLHVDRQYIVKNAPRLLDEMINSLLCLLAMAAEEAAGRRKVPQHLTSIENCMNLVPMFVQAMSDNASPLLQLPHIGPIQLRQMVAKQRNLKSIRQLAQLAEEKRRLLLRSLSDEQYRDVINVCASMPWLDVDYRCEVQDDDDPSIWPFSMVTVTVMLKRSPLLDPTIITNSANSAISGHQCFTINGSNLVNQDSVFTKSDASTHQCSQLYPAADVNNMDTGLMSYGTDFVDDDNDPGKMKKSSAPVWEKKKRKKPVHKSKQQKRQEMTSRQQQRINQQAQQQKSIQQQTSPRSLENSSSSTVAMANGPDMASDASDSYAELDDQSTGLRTDVIDEGVTVPTDQTDVVDDREFNENPSRSVDDELAESRFDDTVDTKAACRSRFRSDRVSSTDARQLCTHAVHCPYFPVEKFEGWWIYIVDRKARLLITKPVYVGNLQTEDELSMCFVAPANPGAYLYTLCVRSDSYVDSVFTKTIRYIVSPLPAQVVDYLRKQEQTREDSSASGSESDESDDDDDDDDYDESDDMAENEEEYYTGASNGILVQNNSEDDNIKSIRQTMAAHPN